MKMGIFKEMFKSFLLLSALLLTINGCAPSRATHGNTLNTEQLQTVTVGETTQQDVLTELGSPTAKAAFNESIWYYIGLDTLKQGFLDAKIENKKVYLVAFDEEGIVSDFKDISAEGIEIPIVARETETYGTELSVMEQLLGNVGRFNRSQIESQRPR